MTTHFNPNVVYMRHPDWAVRVGDTFRVRREGELCLITLVGFADTGTEVCALCESRVCAGDGVFRVPLYDLGLEEV